MSRGRKRFLFLRKLPGLRWRHAPAGSGTAVFIPAVFPWRLSTSLRIVRYRWRICGKGRADSALHVCSAKPDKRKQDGYPSNASDYSLPHVHSPQKLLRFYHITTEMCCQIIDGKNTELIPYNEQYNANPSCTALPLYKKGLFVGFAIVLLQPFLLPLYST